jgi:hyaluronan synthase
MNGYPIKLNNRYFGLLPVVNRWFYRLFLFCLLGLAAFFIVWLKSQTIPEFFANPVVVIYTIFVTAFVFYRLSAAAFYKHNFDKITKTADPAFYEPLVSFVIPCKNEERAISQTIAKCFAVNYPKERFEVIVINDGSTDGTAEKLKLLQNEFERLIVIHWEKNHGKRGAMTEGFRQANGEIIVQLDSDSYIEAQNFKHLITPFQNPEIGAVCASAEPENADKNLLTKMQAAYYSLSFHVLKAAESTFFSVFCCSGCSSAYRKSAVLPVLERWQNEMFLGKPVTWGDDRALTSWLLKSGFKTIFTNQVRAFTIVPVRFPQLVKQQLRWKKSWIINSILTSRFLYKKQPFIAFSYYFPLIIISFLTPLITFWAIVFVPVSRGVFPFFYLAGIFFVTTLFIVFSKLVSKNKTYWPYLFAWVIFNMVFLSYVNIYALFRLNDRGWGTR